MALLALIVLGGGAYAAYDWVQRQYYVGVEDGNVAIFRGVSQDLGPIRLSSVEESSIQTADLPDFYRNRVENTVSTSTSRTRTSWSTACGPRRSAVCPARRRAAPAARVSPRRRRPDDQRHDDRPHPDDDALGRRDECAMTTVSSLPPRQGRNVELSLLLAVGIVVIAYLNVGLATQGSFPRAARPRHGPARHLPGLPHAAALEGVVRRILCSCRSSRSSTASAW